jgi:hypothetical protein
MTASTLERRLSVLEHALLPPPQVQVPSATELFTRAVGEPDPWQRQVLQLLRHGPY